MEDELECFRRAAELGCPDFALVTEGQIGMVLKDFPLLNPRAHWLLLPFGRPRVDRYAAAVCEIWWMQREEDASEEFSYCNLVHNSEAAARIAVAMQMRDQARAFGKKYGSY